MELRLLLAIVNFEIFACSQQQQQQRSRRVLRGRRGLVGSDVRAEGELCECVCVF